MLTAVDSNDMSSLKTLLEKTSPDLGSIDDATAEMYRSAILTYINNNPDQDLTLDTIVSVLSGGNVIYLFGKLTKTIITTTLSCKGNRSGR